MIETVLILATMFFLCLSFAFMYISFHDLFTRKSTPFMIITFISYMIFLVLFIIVKNRGTI